MTPTTGNSVTVAAQANKSNDHNDSEDDDTLPAVLATGRERGVWGLVVVVVELVVDTLNAVGTAAGGCWVVGLGTAAATAG